MDQLHSFVQNTPIGDQRARKIIEVVERLSNTPGKTSIVYDFQTAFPHKHKALNDDLHCRASTNTGSAVHDKREQMTRCSGKHLSTFSVPPAFPFVDQ